MAGRARQRHREHRPRGARDHLGNPKDWRRYLARLLSPERARWQKPEKVVAALGLRAGQTACEIGTGPGYFAFRLARAVGPRGHVYAVDAEPRMLALLAARLAGSRRKNITPVVGLPGDPLLPPRACDLVLLVNAYHHLHDGPRYLDRLRWALRPGGRIVNIDFDRRETPVGPPLEHRVGRERFVREARRARLRPVEELGFLPYQYAVILEPQNRKASPRVRRRRPSAGPAVPAGTRRGRSRWTPPGRAERADDLLLARGAARRTRRSGPPPAPRPGRQRALRVHERLLSRRSRTELPPRRPARRQPRQPTDRGRVSRQVRRPSTG